MDKAKVCTTITYTSTYTSFIYYRKILKPLNEKADAQYRNGHNTICVYHRIMRIQYSLYGNKNTTVTTQTYEYIYINRFSAHCFFSY